MITYKQACEQGGYDRSVKCPIEPITIWYAYKEGEVKEFYTHEEAKKFSKNVESKVINKASISNWWDNRKHLESAATAVWFSALKEEYLSPTFSKELFDLCYNEAYDRGHSAGYDEVAGYMDSIVDFAIKVRETT